MSQYITSLVRAGQMRGCTTLAAIGAVAVVSLMSPSRVEAQTALGTPFIGSNAVSFLTSELTQTGGPGTGAIFGASYARRFGQKTSATQFSIGVRSSARPLDNEKSGVLDVGTSMAVAYYVPQVRGLSFSTSAGAELKAWGNDTANTGRLHTSIPVNSGVAYDVRMGSATFAPFAFATVGHYNIRTSLNDVRQSEEEGWDASYSTGASLRLKEVVVTTSRIVGEHAMPNRSRWTFSAGISF